MALPALLARLLLPLGASAGLTVPVPIEAGRGGSRMPPARLVGVLVIGVALLAVRPIPAAAQSELQMWLNPELGKQIPRADYRYTFYPEQKVEDQNTNFTMTEQRVTLFAPLYQDTKDEWAFAGKVLYQNIDTQARFPEAGGLFPPELWDVSAGISYRHKFDNSWTGGVALTLGSASDEQIFGHTLPIPGIAYAWVPSDKFTALIGFPFSMIRYKPFENLTLDAEYYPFWTVRSRATWEIFQPLRAYAGFQWDSDHFYRADRDDRDDKIFYREMRLYAGIRFDLRHIGFEVTGGYAFNRFYFEGEGYSDRHDNRIDIGSSPFVVGKINLRF